MVGGTVRRLLGIGGSPPPRYRVRVITGDRRNAGTDANVYIILTDERGQNSKDLHCNLLFRNDHERGQTTVIDVEVDAGVEGAIQRLEVWRDNALNIPRLGLIRGILQKDTSPRDSAEWFLDRIEVDEVSDGNCWVFPVHRWIHPDKRYKVELYDCLLPQDDPNIEDRRQELLEKKKLYQYHQNIENGPMQIKELPTDDTFAEKYLISTILTVKHWLQLKGYFLSWLGPDLTIMDNYHQAAKAINMLPADTIFNEKHHPVVTYAKVVMKGLWDNIWSQRTPDSNDSLEAYTVWQQDEWFGSQRLQGVNPVIIKLCTEIPDKLDVTPEMVESQLGGLSLNEALNNKKIFICDLEIMKDLEIKEENEVGAPIALFYLNPENILLPIAIQLKQDKAADNPVFTPSDSPNTWLVAKMYYNNAEAQHHQALTHLGLTHLLMEGIVIATKRHLSPSHPLYKLMAPHFLYLLAINSRGLSTLLAPDGWVDRTMTQGRKGIFNLIKKGFQEWRFGRYRRYSQDRIVNGIKGRHLLQESSNRDRPIVFHGHYINKCCRLDGGSDLQACGREEMRSVIPGLGRTYTERRMHVHGIAGYTLHGGPKNTKIARNINYTTFPTKIPKTSHIYQEYKRHSLVPEHLGITYD
ncbi:unnamed protein product, partial [Meganyctiphanes norvegica]